MNIQLKYYFKKLIRQGLTFNKILRALEQSQYFSTEQLEELQNKKLRKIIQHCYKNIPYYREVFDTLNINPGDIKTKKDLEKLPYLDKYIVRENFDKLIAKNTLRLLCNTCTTGGTTGTPGKFLRDYFLINFESASLHRFWRNVGDNNLRRLTLRASVIVPIEQDNPPFWEYNKADDELIMSSYHLLQKNKQVYINKILEFRPEVIYTQPSSACMLAKFFENVEHNLNLKAIFTSSEILTKTQRVFIEKVFECKIFDEYGLAERVAAIHQCEKGTYHIQEDYSIVELLPVDGGFYEICGTHLYNYAMPLLRYKTGDIVIMHESQCSCGRNFREIKEIQGRNIHYILTPNGNKIVCPEIITKGIYNIIETQYEQEEINELKINIVVTPEFSQKDEMQIIDNMKKYISSEMRIIINKVSEIPRGENGKFINVIQKVQGANLLGEIHNE